MFTDSDYSHLTKDELVKRITNLRMEVFNDIVRKEYLIIIDAKKMMIKDMKKELDRHIRQGGKNDRCNELEK